jgi:hypothetical protein
MSGATSVAVIRPKALLASGSDSEGRPREQDHLEQAWLTMAPRAPRCPCWRIPRSCGPRRSRAAGARRRSETGPGGHGVELPDRRPVDTAGRRDQPGPLTRSLAASPSEPGIRWRRWRPLSAGLTSRPPRRPREVSGRCRRETAAASRLVTTTSSEPGRALVAGDSFVIGRAGRVRRRQVARRRRCRDRFPSVK